MSGIIILTIMALGCAYRGEKEIAAVIAVIDVVCIVFLAILKTRGLIA